jgi:hypothetical protein
MYNERRKEVYTGMPTGEPEIPFCQQLVISGEDTYNAGVVDGRRQSGFLEGTHAIVTGNQVCDISDVTDLQDIPELQEPKKQPVIKAIR